MRGRKLISPPKPKKIQANYLTTFQDFYIEETCAPFKTKDGYTVYTVRIRSGHRHDKERRGISRR